MIHLSEECPLGQTKRSYRIAPNSLSSYIILTSDLIHYDEVSPGI